jgi:hypothetical protein
MSRKKQLNVVQAIENAEAFAKAVEESDKYLAGAPERSERGES